MFQINEFLSLLSNAWSDERHYFTPEDEENFNKSVIPFCNYIHTGVKTLSEKDYAVVLDFIRKTIFNFAKNYIGFPLERESIIKNSENFVLFIKEISFYLSGEFVKKTFKKILREMLIFPVKECSSKEYESLFEFYDRSMIFRQVCLSVFVLIPTTLGEEILMPFMKTLRRLPQENIFAFYLYTFNNSYFRANHKIYPDECKPKELYYGIRSGFFSYSHLNNVHIALMDMCNKIDDSKEQTANLDNPIYVLWRIYTAGHLKSIAEYHSYIEKLFCH